HLLEVVVPHALLAEAPLEAAERAADVADVRLRQPERVDVVGLVADLLAPDVVGEAHQGGDVAGAVEHQPVLQVGAPAREHFVGHPAQRLVASGEALARHALGLGGQRAHRAATLLPSPRAPALTSGWPSRRRPARPPPTLSDAVKEAAQAVDGTALHA